MMSFIIAQLVKSLTLTFRGIPLHYENCLCRSAASWDCCDLICCREPSQSRQLLLVVRGPLPKFPSMMDSKGKLRCLLYNTAKNGKMKNDSFKLELPLPLNSNMPQVLITMDVFPISSLFQRYRATKRLLCNLCLLYLGSGTLAIVRYWKFLY